MHTIEYVSVPFTTPFHEQLIEGSRINIHGKVHTHHHKDFAVELLSGPNIVLHVNFRFHHHEHTLVLNASSYGTWGPEIRVHNPLHDGDHFHLHIHVHHSHYNIEVNGTRVAEFPHRYPFFTVQALGIRGGVEVQKIHFEGFPFRNNWNSGSYDYGHGGYIGYGTESYVQPNWSESHEYNQHFGHHHHHH
uniref:Galectin n=1 Tax=Acrobeloides nanus TaxID=290746 RepID=A0A914C0G3_9BILA